MQRYSNTCRSYSVLALLLIAILGAGITALALSLDNPLRMLEDGNSRFTKGSPTHPNGSLGRVAETAAGQKPFAVVLTCSDSRVPPELVFYRGIGDLFVIRDAGNVTDPIVIGSIEYAVGHLHAPLVVVMGHSRCGAVEAAVSGYHGEGHVASIIAKIEPVASGVKSANPNLQGDGLVNAVVAANVRNSIDELLRSSKTVSQAVREGKLTVAGAVYDVSDGKVTWLRSEKPATNPPQIPWGD